MSFTTPPNLEVRFISIFSPPTSTEYTFQVTTQTRTKNKNQNPSTAAPIAVTPALHIAKNSISRLLLIRTARHFNPLRPRTSPSDSRLPSIPPYNSIFFWLLHIRQAVQSSRLSPYLLTQHWRSVHGLQIVLVPSPPALFAPRNQHSLPIWPVLA
ncbi:hypothetical protein FLAG1_01348 [Fusarium langsethiae]|uniref:Uncharacterized protein n=1 Tax=Fusarium langsethiae TaxID=179993 RepID=A0A0M9F464_FUSLA|nr:hypothetical protein FLAG1_01348 [Fusarium langsethiae]